MCPYQILPYGFHDKIMHKSLSNNALKIHFLSPLYQEWGILAVDQMDMQLKNNRNQ
jgi:hypothetical protein